MRNPIKVVKEQYPMAKEAAIETYEKNKTYYAFCAGSIVTSATTYGIIRFLQAKGYGNGYNSNMPIPNLRMNETDLLKNVGASVVAVEYLTERGLREDFTGYAKDFVKNHKNVSVTESPKGRLVVDLILGTE